MQWLQTAWVLLGLKDEGDAVWPRRPGDWAGWVGEEEGSPPLGLAGNCR